ncbi:MAG: hypothetical protein ACK463_22190, partial [Bradyrhizobium sp.]
RGHELQRDRGLAPPLRDLLGKRQAGVGEHRRVGAGLSFSEKIAQWRSQPTVSLQLMTTMIMMSLLAVAVVSVR